MEKTKSKDERVGIRGELTLVHKGSDGKLKTPVQVMRNQIQDAGLAALAALTLNDVAEDDFDWIALGTGTGQATSATELATEISTNGGERAACTGTRTTTTETNDTAQLVTTWTFSGALAITEAGIFNADSAGDMLAYTDFSAINVVSSDTLEATWKVAFAR